MSLGINLAFRDNLILDKKENSRNNEIKFLKNFKKICDEKFKLEKSNKENKNKETLCFLYDIYKKFIEIQIVYKLQKLIMLNNLRQYLNNQNINKSDNEIKNNLLDINKLLKKIRKEIQIYKSYIL
tara:strand:- start:1579 stop:1956 length:378 start_codon:yes stop_codon:yes gene_type:complete